MSKITVVDIQHKTFKKKLQGYDPSDVDQFLDELIETLEDEATQRAALEAESSELRERISHFKAMEESLQNTLILAQRTADEVKASAHKEADLIRAEARVAVEREVAEYGERVNEARRGYQSARETATKAKSELRSLLMTHLALLEQSEQPDVYRPMQAPAQQSGETPGAPQAGSPPAGNGSIAAYTEQM